jgi:hypothetical protein
MKEPLVICSSCHCHTRSDERWCPHCEADLAADAALLSVRPRRIEIQRVLFAVAAMGLTSVACGGDTTDPAVLGSCAPSGGTQQFSCSNHCSCGYNGRCDPNGKCIACNCTSSTHQQCQPDGTCSTRPCYGAPPPLAFA